eukprot:2219065-Amphidinium_carterae.1
MTFRVLSMWWQLEVRNPVLRGNMEVLLQGVRAQDFVQAPNAGQRRDARIHHHDNIPAADLSKRLQGVQLFYKLGMTVGLPHIDAASKIKGLAITEG